MRASQLLLHLFQQPQLAVTLSADTWVHLIRLLRQQQQLARYAYLFRQAGVFTQLPQYARHHLRNAEIIADKQYRQVSAEAAELTQLLAPLQVKPVFLKGAAYALQQGLPAGIGRTFSDLDILVPKEQITAVEQRLSVFGFLPEPVSAYDQHYYRKWTHEIPPLRHHSRGTILDIHHNLIPPISGRAPDIRRFWQQLNLTADGYQVLSLPAMTLHSLIHLFFNEDFKKGFRDLTDLHLLFAGFSEQDWEQLLQLAEQTGFMFELMLACRYTSYLLATPIPAWVMQQTEQYQPSKLRLRLLDFIFLRLLSPQHPLLNTYLDQLAALLALIRGHWLKMPPQILFGHLSVKAFCAVRDALFGKHQFSPKRHG